MSAVKSKTLVIAISEAQYAALQKFAAKEGYQTNLYARLLFEAASGARVAMTKSIRSGDGELEAQLRCVFAMAGQADAYAISQALNISEALAASMLEGWKIGLKPAAAEKKLRKSTPEQLKQRARKAYAKASAEFAALDGGAA